MTTVPPKIPPQQVPGQPTPAKPVDGNAQVIKLPADLANVKTPLQIAGQVIDISKDGTARIRTEKGDVEVKVDPKKTDLRKGENVEVEVPPGRPPREVRVTKENDEPAPPRTTQTPVDVEIQPERPLPPQPAIPIPIVPVQLSEGQDVRLQPVAPEEAAQYNPVPTETITTTLPEVAQYEAQVTVANAQAEALEQVAQLVAPQPQTTAPLPPLLPQLTPPLPGQPQQPLTEFFTVNIPAPANAPVAGLPQITIPSLPGTPVTTPQFPQTGLPPQAAPQIPGQLPEGSPLLTAPIIAPQQLAPRTFDNIRLTPILAPPLRANITALNTEISPAIVEPKIPPSPNIKIGDLLKIIEKPLILQNQKAGEIPAVIIGTTPQKLPVIALISPLTGEKLFFIMNLQDAGVIPGTQITLTPQQALPSIAPITASVTFPPAPAYFLTPEPWPLMDEIQKSLAQILPQAAQAMSNMTPSPSNPAQLGPAALFFLAAVRAGDLSDWLGNSSSDALRRAGKSSLLSRLGLEGSSLTKLASEPVSGEWRGISLPMMWENQMHKIALYYKNDGQQDQKDGQGKQSRFVFDLKLDAMGKVQLDGLFRAQRLDLVVRTQAPLSGSMQSDMRRIYADALGETKITGELSFQFRPEQWVTITPESKNLGVSV